MNLSTLNVLAEKTSKKRCKKVAKIFGGKEKVRIFAARFGRSGTKISSLTILRDYNEVSEKKKGLAEIEIE